MQATITNVAREKERIIVFVSFFDGDEKTYFFQPQVNVNQIEKEIRGTLREKKELQDKTEDIASKLINQVITL